MEIKSEYHQVTIKNVNMNIKIDIYLPNNKKCEAMVNITCLLLLIDWFNLQLCNTPVSTSGRPIGTYEKSKFL